MVIKLTTGAQIGGALRYNEQKVVQKQADVLSTVGFANNDMAAKNRNYTGSVLESQSHKNRRVKKPTLHFALSLHPTEQVSDEKFRAIAHQFMEGMGYQHQPYIVYRHHDTPHPHIHIVTTCIDETGRKISDSFLKRRTNTMRQKLELQFDLIVAQGRGKVRISQQAQRIEPAREEQVGSVKTQATEDSEKKNQLVALLRQIFRQGTFSSVDQYKALFNVFAKVVCR